MVRGGRLSLWLVETWRGVGTDVDGGWLSWPGVDPYDPAMDGGRRDGVRIARCRCCNDI